MAHKLGAYHHLPPGIANALMITYVLRFNAAEAPTKMGTFPQYAYPHTKARYVECANFCGVCGRDDDETLDLFIEKIEQLKAAVGVKKSIAEYGISEEDFMATLDQMVECFDDPVHGPNPRYPLNERDQRDVHERPIEATKRRRREKGNSHDRTEQKIIIKRASSGLAQEDRIVKLCAGHLKSDVTQKAFTTHWRGGWLPVPPLLGCEWTAAGARFRVNGRTMAQAMADERRT